MKPYLVRRKKTKMVNTAGVQTETKSEPTTAIATAKMGNIQHAQKKMPRIMAQTSLGYHEKKIYSKPSFRLVVQQLWSPQDTIKHSVH